MKNIEKEQLKNFLDIIGTTPAHQIVHFTEDGDVMIDMLSEYCNKHEYLYQINCTNKEFYEKTSERFKETNTTTAVLNFALERRSYMIQAREYNFLFLTSTIDDEIRNEFLAKAHKIIRSAGNIIILIKKEGYEMRDKWVASLEENLFVSTSVIDDMFENYDLIISKKMHGWGI